MISILHSVFAELQSWEWIGILLARTSVGTLFVLSGGGKLFSTQKREKMQETTREAGVPLPKLNAVFVSLVEFVFGALLVVGLLTPLACIMLGGVMVTALATVRVPVIESKSPTGWLGTFLYLPEVMYLVILVWLFLSGSGWLSLDYFVFMAK